MVAIKHGDPVEITAAESSLRLLVVGCGNPTAGDDSAGVEIVRRLRAQGLYVAELHSMPFPNVELLELFGQADLILFIDALSSGARPGTLHLVPLPWSGIEPHGLTTLSSHGWGLAASVDLARALGRPIPRLVLLGIELASVSLGAGCSAAVERAIAAVVEEFPRLRSWLLEAQVAEWRRPLQFSPADLCLLATAPAVAA